MPTNAAVGAWAQSRGSESPQACRLRGALPFADLVRCLVSEHERLQLQRDQLRSENAVLRGLLRAVPGALSCGSSPPERRRRASCWEPCSLSAARVCGSRCLPSPRGEGRDTVRCDKAEDAAQARFCEMGSIRSPFPHRRPHQRPDKPLHSLPSPEAPECVQDLAIPRLGDSSTSAHRKPALSTSPSCGSERKAQRRSGSTPRSQRTVSAGQEHNWQTLSVLLAGVQSAWSPRSVVTPAARR